MAMTNTAVPEAPYRVPPEPSRMPSIVLAALVHAGLLFFLWIGVNWQNTEPVTQEAEVWDMKVQQAAPPPEPAPPPKPEPLPKPAPEPVKAEPPQPPPKVVEQPVAPKPPDIALEREKKQKELKAKQLAEQKEELRKEELKKLQDKKLADAKLEKEKEKEKDKRELAEQKKREQEKVAEAAEKAELAKAKADKAANEKADKLAKSKAAAAEQAKLDKLRDAEMRRITGAAGTSGEAEKSSAPRIDKSYLASIVSKIKNTTSFAGSTDVPGNPRAEFKIEELPTGEIISVKMVKSSGNPAFDDAVEKGIIKSSPLPKKKDGTVERTLVIGFSMKDLN